MDELANPSSAPPGGESSHFDVRSLFRRAADAYEEKVIAMFEGYILSLKGHFNSEVGGLCTDLQSATSAIDQLESKVTGEFEKINQLLKSRFRGDDMEPTLFHILFCIYIIIQSTQRDVEDVAATGTASVGLGANLDEGERGGDYLRVNRLTQLMESNSELRQGDPVNVSSECPIDDPVSGLVNKILSDAGIDKKPLRPSIGSGTVNLGSTDVPQTSSYAIPEKVGIDGVHDDRGEDVVGKKGEDVDEDDVTITKVQAGRVNTDAAGGQTDGGRRFSRRTHTSPKRYTPPAPTVRKKEGNKKVPHQMDDNAQPAKRAVDRVVGWIRKRRDSNPSSKFDFIPPTFFMELLRSYPGFDAMQDKDAFTFPMSLRSQFMHRPQWFTQVDFLYTLMLVKDSHWIGMIVDLPMWAIYVVDANQTCPPTSVVKDVLNPISIMMPHMISRFCLTSRPRELNYLPFFISRLDIPVVLEHPGYSAVVALILVEISAVGKPLIDLSLTEEEVRVAGRTMRYLRWSLYDSGYYIITQFPKDFIELPSEAFSIVIANHIGLRQDVLLCSGRPQLHVNNYIFALTIP
ncbi:hypothetical protein Bca52824_032957 [Brassica carinata]|uniref:Ubiquitin-like protease family profile domain-containing protein n=1 Tax=Brassica carinata TaxID=52824 RepID=A0A8X7V818_BRACI|nr:hypothetical protein Bca52824_032957 [Brassica carinata]